jgi:tRNA-2-methylthio-N6-dimethylallyladenosine synthase
MSNFLIETYGCQMNVADSSEVEARLRQANWKKTDQPHQAQAVIINTCSVRQTAEQRIIGRLGFYKNLKQKQSFKLIIMGCFAQKDGEKLKQEFPFVDLVVGTRNKNQIPDLIMKSQEEAVSLDSIYTSMEHRFDFLKPSPDPLFPQRAFVSVIQGCNNFCSYCIVPYTRGREVSVSSSQILDEIRGLGKKGVREIILLGQNVNSYGKDNQDISFASLLEQVSEIPGIERIKFLTSHPKDFSSELIETFLKTPKVARHVHLPLQSGADAVLKAMNRKYTYSDYKSIIDRIREKAPEVSFSTDILVGFPGETQEDYRKTYEAVREIGYDKAFVFMYSKREGTDSANREETVSPQEKQKRVQQIVDLQHEITAQRLHTQIGKIHRVLIEGRSKKSSSQWFGMSEYDHRVVFDGNPEDPGTFQQVRITGVRGLTLLGEKI